MLGLEVWVYDGGKGMRKKVSIRIRSEVTITGEESQKFLLDRIKKSYQRKGYILFESGGGPGEICYQLDRLETEYLK